MNEVIRVCERSQEDKDEEIAHVINTAFCGLMNSTGLFEDLSDYNVCLEIAKDSKNSPCFVAVYSDKESRQIVGVNFLTTKIDSEARGIGPVAVLPPFKGKGIGKLLIRKVIESVSNETVLYLTVDCHNINALSLYFQCGFRSVCETCLVVALDPKKCLLNEDKEINSQGLTLQKLNPNDSKLIQSCCELHRKTTGFMRRNDLIRRSFEGNSFVLINNKDNSVESFISLLEIEGYTVGISQLSVVNLLSAASKYISETTTQQLNSTNSMTLHIPINQEQVLNWAMKKGRVLKTVLLLSRQSRNGHQPQHIPIDPSLVYLPCCAL